MILEVNAVMQVMSDLSVSDDDQEWIFSKTATELYHL